MNISVVIPTYNSRRLIGPCLESVVGKDASAAETIVVDNGSTDGTINEVRGRFPGVAVVRNSRNLGASAARNQGIAASHGAWVLCLDCDVVLQEGFLRHIKEAALRAGAHTGMIQSKILYADGRRIFSTGIELDAARRFFDRGKGRFDRGRFDRRQDVFGACAAAALYRRAMLDDVRDSHGYFDERFFFLVEDVDLAWRAHKKGWRGVFCPRAVCHHEADSSRTGTLLRQRLCLRNRRLMMKKNETFFGSLLPGFLFPFYDLPRLAYVTLAGGFSRCFSFLIQKKQSAGRSYGCGAPEGAEGERDMEATMPARSHQAEAASGKKKEMSQRF